MKSNIRDRWTAALRSGDYVQGKRALRKKYYDEDGKARITHCCLGVLCDVVDPNGWCNNGDRHRLEEDGLLHYPALVDLELSGAMQFELSRLNDFAGEDFSAIADLIDRNL